MKTNAIKLTVAQIIELTAGAVAAVTHFIDLHVWHPAEGYLVILALVAVDFFTGAGNAWRRGKFETRKAQRVLYKLAGYTLLLAAAHNLGKYEALLAWLPQTIFVPLALLLILSLTKNLSLLGWIPEPVAQWLEKRVDAYKNEERPRP